jgi:hypothetical protein
MNDQPTPGTAKPACEACGEHATRTDADGIWLCDGDYQHLLQHWHLEGWSRALNSSADPTRETRCD